ncbi:transglycosylase domain-containing protein [Holdemania massiliensis]|uniref:transglycosylase domain-containing protein n=1 Tax=Holdemania massiliensis TaxID=1468449 RepID=UPI001F06F272|nr:transglycosylase domain-containing protein [Holdemania massiliensis]MCH1939503.1 transglycosylase domain-containing protein [Holdemania massiliensis]
MKKLITAGCVLTLCGLLALLGFYGYAYLSYVPLLGQDSRIRLYNNQGGLIYESTYQKNSEWINLEDVPQTMIDAVISIEDRRFYQHYGLDPIRIAKAVMVNAENGDIVEGGSTITQQLARNLFLTLDQTWSRKFQEAVYAAKLEMHFSKDQILETYLNTIYYGHGIYGIQKAAAFFFGKELEDCTLGEMAMLAGIPNGPSLFSPFISMENARRRQSVVLQAMVDNEKLSQSEADLAKSEPVLLADFSSQKIMGSSGYYKDAVLAQLKEMGFLDQETLEKGLNVYTYLDPQMQTILQDAVDDHMPDTDQQIAGLILEPFTFNVLAMVGGRDYTTSQYNRALYSTRQVGSTLKPLLYYIALQQGLSPSSTFLSTATQFQISQSVFYSPTNYRNVYPEKEISMINAIGVSDNIYAVKTHLFLGMDLLADGLAAFGIESEEATAAMALGATHFPLIDLAKIYNTFASEGLVDEPSMIRLVTDNAGNILYQRHENPKQLLHRDETLMLSQLLRAPFDIKNLQVMTPSLLGYEPYTTTAAKSGSSDWDSLIAGYNPQMTVVLWSGYDENERLETNEERRVPKLIWKQIFNTVYSQDSPGPWYTLSPQLEERRVDPISGQPNPAGSLYWFRHTDP